MVNFNWEGSPCYKFHAVVGQWLYKVNPPFHQILIIADMIIITLVRLEPPADESLASQFLLLWLGLSCKHDDYHDENYDNCNDEDDNFGNYDVNLHDDIEALRCFGRLNSIDF